MFTVICSCVILQLEVSALPGDDTISLSEDVDWSVGDHLVITASERGAGLTDTEEVEIAEVLGPRAFRLTAPLEHLHRVQWFRQEGFAPVDMRVEAGLLSRNVIIQGDEGSTQQLYGVHVASMHGAALRLSGVEIRRCGQAFILGRYCSHFHMGGRMEDSYIVDNSIHHSFQRAVTVHATHYALVKNNVAYNVRGHTFFVEDGNEHGNVFEGNLAAMTLCSEGPLDGDSKPAGFWTSSPANIWRHNVAAGSCSSGWWFELAGHPGA